MSDINYVACLKKIYPTITDSDFSFEQDEEGLRLLWNNEATFGVAPSFASLEAQWLGLYKTQALLEVKDIRRQGLDKAALSPGILAIYNANYEASIAYLDNRGSEVMKNGITAEAYLTGFGARLGMSATQFANYIIAENYRVGPTVYDVEKRYLALTYGGDASAGITPISYLPSVEAVKSAVDGFRVYCGL